MIKIKERCLLSEMSEVVLDLKVGSTFCLLSLKSAEDFTGITTKDSRPQCLYLKLINWNFVMRKTEDNPAGFLKYHLALWKHMG